LDVEEEHETYVEDGHKKSSELERKVEVYEKIDRADDVNKTLQDLFAKERVYHDKIEELQQKNKHLEHKLKKKAKKKIIQAMMKRN